MKLQTTGNIRELRFFSRKKKKMWPCQNRRAYLLQASIYHQRFTQRCTVPAPRSLQSNVSIPTSLPACLCNVGGNPSGYGENVHTPCGSCPGWDVNGGPRCCKARLGDSRSILLCLNKKVWALTPNSMQIYSKGSFTLALVSEKRSAFGSLFRGVLLPTPPPSLI